MRTLSAFLLVASTLLGATAVSAQAPAPPGAGRQAEQGPGMGRGQGRSDGQRLGRRRAMGARAALRGITLSDAQRTQLRAVADKYRTERRALADQARAQWGRRAAEGSASSTARPDSGARAAVRTRAQDLRQRQLNDVRAVLTAEQRTVFDRNVAERRTRAAEFRRGGRGAQRGLPGAR